mmetsp:Transcript_36300/g.26413  ORF Transcript_36300/g.26413 Transcript_36300/m.26413 type:complete len:149 (-) Transcript_36300:336-782(-)
MLFINCHLPHGNEASELRNEHFNMLYQKFVLKNNNPRPQKVSQNVVIPAAKKPEFDCIIWLGDFNYRINGIKSAVMEAMAQDMFEVLKFNDQFWLERKLGRIAPGFQEGDVEFAPTFKRLFNSFDYNAKRVPSWTDRIIYYNTDDSLI